MFIEVECGGGDSSWRLGGGESVMVIVPVYILSLSPSLFYLVGRQRCTFWTSYLGGHK